MEHTVTPFTSSLKRAADEVRRIEALELAYQKLECAHSVLGEHYSSTHYVMEGVEALLDALLDQILRAQ
jgi:hypothetical protein